MISWPERRPVTSGTRWRNSRSTPASSARADDRRQLRRRVTGLEPAGQPLEGRLEGPDALPSAAASLSDSTRAEVAAGGQAERLSSSRISPTWPIRIVGVRDPQRSAATSRPAR